MSLNVGDTIPFILAGAPSDGSETYVFKWWDNTVDASISPAIEKTLNVGGTLQMSITQSDQFGQSHIYNGSVIVNFPPVVIGSPTISANDLAFPFSSFLASTAYDPEHPGGTELTFQWYDGGTLIGAGTTVVVSTGTYRNTLEVDGIASDETLTQIITDQQNGVTRVNYFLRGFAPLGPQGSTSSINNSIVNSANNLSEIIIGPGGTATFTAYAQDTAPGQLQFFWFAGTLNGWTNMYSLLDTPPQLADGLFRSQFTVPVGTETPGLKTVNCTVTNLNTNQDIVLNSTINLIAPLTPVVTGISTDAPIINGGYAVSQSGFVHFSAAANDPNNALLDYKWTFTQPTLTLYGRTIMLRPSDYAVFAEATLVGNGTNTGTGPLPIIGQITVTDRYGQTNTVSINQFITTLVWPFTQVSPQTSGTGSTSLQKRYWGVATDSTLTTDDLATLTTDFSSQRNQSNTFGPANQYIYIVYPASFGLATITVNGSIATNWLLTVATFNAVNYNVYRSATPLIGGYQIVIS